MNKLLLCLFILASAALHAQVGIGTTTPSANSVLDLQSATNNQGLLAPRLTTVQRTAASFVGSLGLTDNGLLVFDSDEKKFYYWNTLTWVGLETGAGTASGPAGGDLAGTYPNPAIANGAVTLAKIAPSSTNGQVLTTVAGTAQWNDLPPATGGTITNIATGTGLMGGPITTSGTISLANTTVEAGTYGSSTQVGQFSVDTQGRITSAGNVPISGAPPVGGAGGDLTGSYPNPIIAKLAGNDLSPIVPAASEVLKFNGTAWAPAADANAGGTVTNIATGTGLAGGPISTTGTISLANTAVTPATYGDGTHVSQILVDAQGRITGASSVSITGASPTGAAAGDLTGTYPDPAIAANAGNNIVSALNNTLTTSTILSAKLAPAVVLDTESPAGGDVSGSYSTGLQLNPSTVSTNEIIDGTIATADLANLSVTDAKVASGLTPVKIAPSATNGQVLTTVGAATKWADLPATGSVTSVATGTGLTGGPVTTTGTISLANTAVTPGSYGTATQVGQFTVDAQGRITGASSITITGAAPTGAAGGDLSGSYPNPTIGKLSGTALSSTAPAANQVLKYNGTAWAPAADANSGGTITSITAGAGLSGGTITSAGTISLPNSGVVASTYGDATHVPVIGVDAQGRITTASNTVISGVAPGGAASGDLSGNYPAPTIATSAGNDIVSAVNNVSTTSTIGTAKLTPGTAGQVLTTVAGAAQWATPSSGTVSIVSGTAPIVVANGTTTPVISLANTAVTAGSYGSSTSIPQITVDAQGRLTAAASSAIPTASSTVSGLLSSSDFTTFSNKLSASSTLAGDVSGTIAAVSVDRIKGTPLTATAPVANQVLKYNGSAWAPAADANSGGTVTSIATGTGLTGGPISGTGTIALANTAVTAGSYGSSTSIPQITVDAQGRLTAAASSAIPTASSTVTGLLTSSDYTNFNNKLGTGSPLGGDVSGTFGAVSVDKIKGTPIASTAPATNQILQYNGTVWTPANAVSGFANPMTAAGDLIYGATGGTPTRLPAGTGFLRGGSTPSYSAINLASADVTGSLPVSNGGTGATTAAGALANLGGVTSSLTNGNVLVGNSSNVATSVAVSGDAAISNTGVITISPSAISGGTGGKIADATITNADISATAALAGTKITPAFGAQAVSTTSSVTAATVNVNGLSYTWPGSQASGVLTNSGTGTLTWAPSGGSGTVTNVSGTSPVTVLNGTTTPVIGLSNSGVAAATYGDASSIPQITVDALGRITSATTIAVSGASGDAGGDLSGTYPAPNINTETAGPDIIEAINNNGGEGETISSNRLGGDVVTVLSNPAVNDIGGNYEGGFYINSSAVTTDKIDPSGSFGQVLTIGDGGAEWADVGGGSVTNVSGTAPIVVANGTTTPVISLASSGVSPASYGTSTQVPQFTVDAQGRITTATNVTITGAAPTGAAGGDLSGNYPNPTIAKLSGTTLSATAPATNQVLKYNGTAWAPAADAGFANPLTTPGDLIYGATGGTPTRLPAGTGFLRGGSTPAYSSVNLASGDVTGSLPIANGGTNATTAGGALSNLGGLSSSLTSGNIFVGNASNVATAVTVSGDATLSNAGVLTISPSAVTTGKIAPTGAAGQVLTIVSGAAQWATPVTGGPPTGTAGGDLTGSYPNPTIGASTVTSAKILDATIVDADVASSGITTAGKVSGNAITSGTISGSTAANTSGAITTSNAISGGTTTLTTTAITAKNNSTPNATIVATNSSAGTNATAISATSGANGIYSYATGTGIGVWGYSAAGTGIEGQTSNVNGGYGVYGVGSGAPGPSETTTYSYGIYGTNNYSGSYGYIGGDYGVYGNGSTGIYGESNYGYGVQGYTATGSAGGSFSNSSSGYGLLASSYTGTGIYASSYYGTALSAYSSNSYGVYAQTNGGSTQYAIYAAGRAGGSTAWNAPSDIRYKKNITTLSSSLTKVLKMRGVSYNWRTDEFPKKSFSTERELGVIAQEIKEILPEVVFEDKDGYYSVTYERIVPVLIEAIKEQQAQIAELKKAQEEMVSLKSRMAALEALLVPSGDKGNKNEKSSIAGSNIISKR